MQRNLAFASRFCIELTAVVSDEAGYSETTAVLPYCDVSNVKLFVTFISFQTTTRAVFNLYLSCLKRQLEKSKICSTEAKILGSRRVLVQDNIPSSAALLQPQKKQFSFLLCPCKSQKIEIPCAEFAYYYIYSFKKQISGCIEALGSAHLLLRSRPTSDALELPIVTPSGLIKGTSFTIQFERIESQFSAFVTSIWRIYFIIKEP